MVESEKPPVQRAQYDVFISHAREDTDIAGSLFDLLSARIRVFLDSRCIPLGADWDNSIRVAHQACCMTVALVSVRGADADYFRAEIDAALDMSQNGSTPHLVLPVFLLNPNEFMAVPYGLRLKQGIFAEQFGNDFSKISEVILTRLADFQRPDNQSTDDGLFEVGVANLPIVATAIVGVKAIAQTAFKAKNSGYLLVDHGTLTGAYHALQTAQWKTDPFALASIIQLIESLILCDELVVVRDSHSHAWERDTNSPLRGAVTGLRLDAREYNEVRTAALTWFDDWGKDRDAHFLVHYFVQAELQSRSLVATDYLSRRSSARRRMLEYEDDEVVKTSERIWGTFISRHRAFSVPASLKAQWNLQTLMPLGSDMVAVILWTVWRTILYETVAASLGIQYAPHPARASILVFESGGRHHEFARMVFSEISGHHQNYESWATKVGLAKAFSFGMPPIFGYIVKKCRSAEDLIEQTVRLRDDPYISDFRSRLLHMQSAIGLKPRQVEAAVSELDKICTEAARQWNIDSSSRRRMTFFQSGAFPIFDSVWRALASAGRRHQFFVRSLVDDIRYANELSRQFSRAIAEFDIPLTSGLESAELIERRRRAALLRDRNATGKNAPPPQQFPSEVMHVIDIARGWAT